MTSVKTLEDVSGITTLWVVEVKKELDGIVLPSVCQPYSTQFVLIAIFLRSFYIVALQTNVTRVTVAAESTLNRRTVNGDIDLLHVERADPEDIA